MAAPGFDVAVVGAGFGGMAAALDLAERGASVVLLEALRYPGGCASTFVRGGVRYESGATLFSGLGPGQLFTSWIERHRLDVRTTLLDPLIELRGDFAPVVIGQDKARLVADLAAGAGPGADGVRGFFATQGRAADTLWALFDDPALLPPLGGAALGRHLLRSPGYARLLPWMGQPLGKLIARTGLVDRRTRAFLNATCQITVQCPADEAEAPFAMAALDYPFRGTGHVEGGIGQLAEAVLGAIEATGGEVRRARRVTRIEGDGPGYSLLTSKGETVRARAVVANLLPAALAKCLAEEAPGLAPKRAAVERGWGAAMLYRVARAPASAPQAAHHLALIDDDQAPLDHGNHVFLSISGADEDRGVPPGHRTITASTHVDAAGWAGLPPGEQARVVDDVHRRMRATIARRAPAWAAGTVSELTASPRTFARFVGRPGGFVGGVPKRASRAHYRGLFPRPVRPGLYIVGDAVFPGQSTLACALGGLRTAAHLAHTL